MSRPALAGVALFAALAAWLSQGTIGFAGTDGPRLAVLPLTGGALAIVVLAGIAVPGLHRAGASFWPVVLLGLLLLPWLPFPVPPAFLLWTGPVAAIVWVAVLVLMMASLPRRPSIHLRNPRVAAAVFACALFALAAWRAAPMVPGGDEPHYLIITQSLLLDGGLRIDGVHRRGDYRAYYGGDLPPHVQRRGRNGELYSVHAPGLPVLVAPAFAVGGYPAAVVFLVLLASAGSALAWHLAWLATGRRDAAWFAWAAVTLPATAIFQSFTIYPDGPGGVLALTGLWALLRAERESKSGAAHATPWLLHGAALALLPWFHSRFAVLAGWFGALILLRLSSTRNPAAKAAAFLSVPALSAILWIGFFMALYGRPDPTAPYGPGEIGSFRFVPGGLGGLLFDQRFGLLAYAPVIACGFIGLGLMLARRDRRRLALELLAVVAPYLLTVTHFAMWWGGWSAPARFFAPILPLFVVPAAVGWTLFGRPGRVLASGALILTGVASAIVVGIGRGRLAFNTRDAPALWLEWAGRLADLTAAAPMWARDTDAPLFRAIAVWIAAAVLVWAALRVADASGRLRQAAAFRTMGAAALAAAVMAASSIVWRLEGVTGRAIIPSQLHLLGTVAAAPRAAALQVDGWSPVPARELPARLSLEVSRTPTARSAGRGTPPLFSLPPFPAGDYRVRATSGGARGWMMLGIASDQFALRTVQLPAGAVHLSFPLPVRGLLVRGDEDARRAVRGLVIEPVRVLRPAERLTGEVARRAVRYGSATVYFLDDRSYPEPEAFWAGGARDTTVVIQPDGERNAAVLHLRNAPVDNRVTFESGGWADELRLGPGEERAIRVPLDTTRGGAVVRIETSAGFRPSEHEEGSRDHRLLGVWVRVE